MRCPDCNKFASFDTDTEPEIEANVDPTIGTVTVEARIVNTCAECGTELKEATFNMESDDLAEEVEEHKATCADMKLSVKNESFSRTDRRQTHTPKGKPITNPRYAKQFYGVEGKVEVECDECGHTFSDVELSDEVQASGMDELV